jgi:hypothetical protein
MTAKSQTERVLDLLRVRGEQGLTPLEALELVGTFRLAHCIWVAKTLIRDDEEIVTETATSPAGKSFARYVLRRKVAADGSTQATLPW